MDTCLAYGHGWAKTSCPHSRHTRGRCSVINVSNTATPSLLVSPCDWHTLALQLSFGVTPTDLRQTGIRLFPSPLEILPDKVLVSFISVSSLPPWWIVSVVDIGTQQHKRRGHPNMTRWWHFLEGVTLLKQTKSFSYNIRVTFLACPFMAKGRGRGGWGGGRGQGRRKDLCIFLLHWSSWIVT